METHKAARVSSWDAAHRGARTIHEEGIVMSVGNEPKRSSVSMTWMPRVLDLFMQLNMHLRTVSLRERLLDARMVRAAEGRHADTKEVVSRAERQAQTRCPTPQWNGKQSRCFSNRNGFD